MNTDAIDELQSKQQITEVLYRISHVNGFRATQ